MEHSVKMNITPRFNGIHFLREANHNLSAETLEKKAQLLQQQYGQPVTLIPAYYQYKDPMIKGLMVLTGEDSEKYRMLKGITEDSDLVPAKQKAGMLKQCQEIFFNPHNYFRPL